MNTNSEGQILLELYSKCYIPIGKIYKSFFESKNIGMESMMRAFSEARDIKDLKDVCNSVIQSKKIELENLKKSYESFDEAKKNYCKSFYEEVFSSKKFILERWESEYKSLLEAEEENGDTKYQTECKNIMSMCVFCFIKSPEFGDDKWHLNFIDSGWMKDSFEKNKDVDYVSYCDEDGKRRLYRTSEMMFLVNNQSLAHMLIDRTVDSEEQIKMLKDAGFKEFTVQFDEQIKWFGGEIRGNKLKIVDENGKIVDYMQEEYQKLDNDFYRKLNSGCEYINLAHDNQIDPISNDMKDKLHSVIILSKNTEMNGGWICPSNGVGGYYCSSFYRAKKPLTFYCKPGSEAAIDILSKFKDEEHYPEFYNATIVFMSPKLVVDYQKNLDDVGNYREMKEFIKSYKGNEAYFSIKLSDCIDYSNQRIEQLLLAQKEFSNTWENFTNFMEIIGVKEKSNVEKDVEHANESTDKNDTIGASDDQNQNQNQKNIEFIKNNEKKDDEVEKSDNKEIDVKKDVEHINESANENDEIKTSDDQNQNQKNIEFINANEKKEAKIGEAGNKSENEPKPELKDKKEMSTQNSSLEENVEKELTQNVENKTSENKDIKIGDSEDHLNVFMQYLKNHWPRIFKFLNAVCNFFNRFRNKSKSDDTNSLENITDKEKPTQSLIDKTSFLLSNKNVINGPNDIETVQPVIKQERR